MENRRRKVGKVFEVVEGITKGRKRYDVDISELQKGDHIHARVLSKLFGTTPEYTLYGRCFEFLKKQIRRESSADGEILFCRMSAHGLQVLTDKEAIYYKQDQHRIYVDRLERTHLDLHLIKTRNLSKKDREVLKKEKALQKQVMDAIEKAMEA